jgi:hypothetical protein
MIDSTCRWVCTACGKTSPRFFPNPEADRGFDESCMLNCVWCRPSTPDDPPLLDPPETQRFAWRQLSQEEENEQRALDQKVLDALVEAERARNRARRGF